MTCCAGAEGAGGAGGGTGSGVVTVPVSGIAVASGLVSELVVVAAILLVAKVLLPGVSVVLEKGVGMSLLVPPAQPESASDTAPKSVRTRWRVFIEEELFQLGPEREAGGR